MTANEFAAWMARHGLNKGQAAEVLGIGKNTVTKYCRSGGPKWLGLACFGYSVKAGLS